MKFYWVVWKIYIFYLWEGGGKGKGLGKKGLRSTFHGGSDTLIYENVEKKDSFQNKHIHIWVTDILKFYDVFVHILKVLSVFKNSCYAYSPL